ncbi:sensor histidine kinase [Pseudonocardia oceani]|nr:sensor histidine kinase [Pseudonocardia oceani]
MGRIARSYAYLLAGFPLGTAAFVVVVTGTAVGAGTLVVWVGLPVLVAVLAAARGFAGAERALVRTAGIALPAHHHREPRGRGLGRLWSRLADAQSWRELLHALVAFPVHVVTFSVALAWGVGAVGGVTSAAWLWSIPRDDGVSGLFGLVTGISSLVAEIASTTLAGVLLLLTLPLVLRGLVAAQAGLARALLTNEAAALRERAAALESSRRSAVQAEAQTLRRVERDLHDGPQQRLVRLTMDLEAVARRLDDDPERARPLVAGALVQSREALAELRALSRGIAPPILADRGLGPALAAAAARCPTPVVLDVDLPDGLRMPEAVESTAYFVVTEALTNVAKHAGASQCVVAVGVDGDRVLVQVRDDGRGGAHPGKGHGLAGLADRLAAVEGALDLVSPVGGPTVLTAEIPMVGVG